MRLKLNQNWTRCAMIANAERFYNNRVKILFDRIFPEKERRATVRYNVKWFNSKAKQFKIKCSTYDRTCEKKVRRQESLSQQTRIHIEELLNQEKRDLKVKGKILFAVTYDILGKLKQNYLSD